MKKKGFTLIELLAIIIILSLILILALPRITSTIREAKFKGITSNVIAIHKSVEGDLLKAEMKLIEYEIDESLEGKVCPKKFRAKDDECIYFYNYEIGIESLVIVLTIPSNTNSEYKYVSYNGEQTLFHYDVELDYESLY